MVVVVVMAVDVDDVRRRYCWDETPAVAWRSKIILKQFVISIMTIDGRYDYLLPVKRTIA